MPRNAPYRATCCAIPLTTDPSVIEANALMATALATQIKVVSEIIKTYDERIETLFDTLQDAGLFKSLPGMGLCMGPRMLAALGDNRDRFNSAEEIQNYAGIAPVTERSGQKSWVHWRWQCAKFVRQTPVEWAAKTVNSSDWARLYYQGLREKGKSHQSAIRALAFKWIRIIYRCWKTGTQYDEAKYLLASVSATLALTEAINSLSNVSGREADRSTSHRFIIY